MRSLPLVERTHAPSVLSARRRTEHLLGIARQEEIEHMFVTAPAPALAQLPEAPACRTGVRQRDAPRHGRSRVVQDRRPKVVLAIAFLGS